MAYDTRFGPDAQTPEQRARVLARMQTAIPALKTQASVGAAALHPLRGR